MNIEQIVIDKDGYMGWFEERLPKTKEAFAKLREIIYKDGALDVKTKELISVAADGR